MIRRNGARVRTYLYLMRTATAKTEECTGEGRDIKRYTLFITPWTMNIYVHSDFVGHSDFLGRFSLNIWSRSCVHGQN